MRPPSWPTVLLQATTDPEAGPLVETIVFYILAGAFAAGFAVVGVWMYRDARRRGQTPAVWAAVWSVPAAIGLVVAVLGLMAGEPVGSALAFIGFLIVGGLVVLVLWLSARPYTVLYDAKGSPVHPKAILRPDPRFIPGEPPPSRRAAPVGHGWRPAPAMPAYAPGPAPVPAQRAQVRCPNCQTVFEYAKNSWGPARVQCPRCGLSGTI